MVCKEDVLSWFKDLECYKRIDLMHEMLNMCMPFEIRFVGTCVEEIGKQTFQELHGLAVIANDVEKLSKDSSLYPGLLDECTRSRVILYISLLTSRHCSSAEWMFKTLFRTEVFEDFVVKGGSKDEAIQNELLLLLTMGLHHPAFTFDQKSFFGKLLEHLEHQRERKCEPIPKFNAFCAPPGFAYPPAHVISSHSDMHVLPNKAMLGSGDITQHPPPGLPVHTVPPQPLDFLWQRPAFGGNICISSEVPPFPAPLSPLVSQPTSPPSSRATSPHRNYTIRSVTGMPLTHNVELQSNLQTSLPQMGVDTMSTSSLMPKYFVREEENNPQEDKVREPKWLNSFEIKPPNGLMSYIKEAPGYFCNQMQALKLEGENSLHCSTSSSESSLNQSPPQTPSAGILVAPHGPGRGNDGKPRMNGMPFLGPPPPVPPVCDSTPPPPFANCSVPYSNYATPPPVPLSRCFIQYTQPIRPTIYTTHASFAQNTEHFNPTTTYLPFPILSSIVPPRNPNCYNCGALGHMGSDCTAQTIDDITQKPYMLEYAPMSDGNK